MTAKGQPFYYVADTHWPLPWHYTLREAYEIAADRAALNFTALQMSLVPFGDVTNANGDHIFLNRTTLTPNPRFFEHCDALFDQLESLGFAVYLVILWWNQVMQVLRRGPPLQCHEFGRWLGSRWRHRQNLVWVIGGDARWRSADLPYFRALAQGLRDANASQLITFHPQSDHSSSNYLSGEAWIDFHSVQVHRDPENVAAKAIVDRQSGKPTLVCETNYFWRRHCESIYGTRFCIHGDAHVVRASHWAARLGGGSLGEGYGAWPFWTGVAPREQWWPALSNQPAARQIATMMQSIMLQYPWYAMRPDPAPGRVVVRNEPDAERFYWAVAATTEAEAELQAVLVYFPRRDAYAVTIDLGWFGMADVEMVWYSAATGSALSVTIVRPNASDENMHRVFDPSTVTGAEQSEGNEQEDLVLGLRAQAAVPPPAS